MIEILHYLKDPNLWELWYIPYSMRQCRGFISSTEVPVMRKDPAASIEQTVLLLRWVAESVTCRILRQHGEGAMDHLAQLRTFLWGSRWGRSPQDRGGGGAREG